MKKHIVQGDLRSTRYTDKQQTPPRVASRLEGVVKNKGTKNVKKEPRGDK